MQGILEFILYSIVRSGSLSRQSTNDSDTDITSQTHSVTSSNAQPIKKSPREFIIPIAVEGGGFVTPRAGSLEPSESTNSSFNHIGRPRKIRYKIYAKLYFVAGIESIFFVTTPKLNVK